MIKRLVKFKSILLSVQAGLCVLTPIIASNMDSNWAGIGALVLGQLLLVAVLMQVAREELIMMLEKGLDK